MTAREKVWLKAWLEACKSDKLGMNPSECTRYATQCLRAFDKEFYPDD